MVKNKKAPTFIKNVIMIVFAQISVKKIGEAPIICAKTRPRLIGGERALYNFKEDIER